MTDRRWPPVIHSRGYDAYLCGVQILAGGDETPIYRFPGGQSLVDDSELKKPAERKNSGTANRARQFTATPICPGRRIWIKMTL